MERKNGMWYSIILCLNILGASCQTLKVLKTKEDFDLFKDGSGARLKFEQNSVKLVNISLCFRFYFFSKWDRYCRLVESRSDHDGNLIFSVSETDEMREDNHVNNISLFKAMAPILIDWPIHEWHHACWSYNNKSSVLSFVSNGQTFLEKVMVRFKRYSFSIPEEVLQNIFIMRRSKFRSENKKFYPCLVR